MANEGTEEEFDQMLNEAIHLGVDYMQKKDFQINDFLYDGESVCIGRKGTIDRPIFITGKFWTVDTLFYTHSFFNCLPKFLYLIFQKIDWYKFNEAGGVPSLSKTTIGEINVFIPIEEDGGLKGSGRSIEAYSMFEELTKCKDLLSKFGGHPMAAGLSLPMENLEAFRHRLNEQTALTKEDLVEKVVIDVPMPLGYMNERLIEQLDLLEPFGKGNNKPIFAQKHLKAVAGKILGKNKNVLKLLVESEEGCQMDALYFGDLDDMMEKLAKSYGQDQVDALLQGRYNTIYFDCTYYPTINEFRGIRSLQIIIQNYQCS